jgi:acetolactate synthase-1/2/3 large subunit
MLTGARLLLHTLEKLKVETIFGYPGGAVIPIFNELYDFPNLDVHFCRHEQAAAHNAEGYSAIKGKTGVCLVTSGPGVTNTVTGIMDAQMDSRAMLVISGQVASNMIGKMAFQECDIVSITKPITKRSVQVNNIQEMIDEVVNCYFLASHGRKGPTLVDIPKDIQQRKCANACRNLIDESITKHQKLYARKQTKVNLDEFNEKLKNAKKPIVLFGAGVRNAQMTNQFAEFVNAQQLPVVATLHGIDAYNNFESLYLGMAGMHGNAAANYALDEADLVIGMGTRFDDRITSNPETFIPNAKIIHVELDKNEINKMKTADVVINADLTDVLQQLAVQSKLTSDLSKWHDTVKKLKEHYQLKLSESNQLQMRDVISFINNENENEIVVSDVGQHQMFTALYYKFKTGRLINSGGAGTMGFALPAAIGAKIASPDKRVICFVGDGGFQMTNQELITLSTVPKGIKFVLLNNNYLGMVRQWQELFHDKRYSYVNLENSPDFELLVKSYGLVPITINNHNDLVENQTKFIDNQNYVFICNIETEENVYPMIPPGGSIKDIKL